MNNCGNSDRLPMIEKYLDVSVGAMVRGGCLPVRGNKRMSGSMIMNIVLYVW